MNHPTTNRMTRSLALLVATAGLAQLTAPTFSSAATEVLGLGYEANHCDDISGSAPIGAWFPITSYDHATASGQDDGCVWSDEADAFIRWIAPSNGTVTASVCPGGDVTPQWVLEMREDCDGELLACGFKTPFEELPGSCVLGAQVVQEVRAGQTYVFRVGGALEANGGPYGQSMLIEFEAAPALTGDLNGDGRVNGEDLGLLFANWTG